MTKTFFTLCLILAFQVLLAQSQDVSRIFVEKYFSPVDTTLSLAGIEVDGSPYLNDSFEKGEFQIGLTRYLSPMRYNIFLDAFEVEQGEKIVFLNKNLVGEISLNNAQFIYLNDGSHKQVYEVLNQTDSLSFLKKHAVAYSEGKIDKKGKVKKHPGFKPKKPTYLVKTSDGKMLPIAKMADIMALKPAKINDSKAFCKDNKLKKKKEADWIKLFIYVAGLKIE